MEVVRASGLGYLALVTDLLQRQRLADPLRGLWEAADLQWWYTRDPHPGEEDGVFWLDSGVPVTATVFTRWSATRYGCDVLGRADFAPAWDTVRQRCAELPGVSIEMCILPESLDQAAGCGFTTLAEEYWSCWLDAADRARPRPLPDGYTLLARAEHDGPHPMIGRNGEHVEDRLRQCSLYDPSCDLAIIAADESVAGYALFWPDPRTTVGLVEPMRVEDAHNGRGLGGALLREGLDRLAQRGCRRLKVSVEANNHAAQKLYQHAGFTRHRKEPVYTRTTPANAQ